MGCFPPPSQVPRIAPHCEMSRPPSTYSLKATELDAVYEMESSFEVRGEIVEARYVSRVPWVRGATITRTARAGLYMHWADEIFDREVRLRCDEEMDFYILTLALEGCWQEMSHGRRRACERPAGTMALIRYAESKEHRAKASQQGRSSRHLSIGIEGCQLRDWLTEEELAAHPRLHDFLSGKGEPCLVTPLSFRARLVAEQIQNCPYQGLARALSMESRCLDLLVEMMASLEHSDVGTHRRINRQEAERIHAAAEILHQFITEPPSLADLARQVGLSESKLKAGFHHVFGTTAFGYLRKQRMEKARQMLVTGEHSILDAAHIVGISNPSHFASLFKQQFGVNPKQFQLNAVRQK